MQLSQDLLDADSNEELAYVVYLERGDKQCSKTLDSQVTTSSERASQVLDNGQEASESSVRITDLNTGNVQTDGLSAKSLFSSLVAREKRKKNRQFIPPRKVEMPLRKKKIQPEPEPKDMLLKRHTAQRKEVYSTFKSRQKMEHADDAKQKGKSPINEVKSGLECKVMGAKDFLDDASAFCGPIKRKLVFSEKLEESNSQETATFAPISADKESLNNNFQPMIHSPKNMKSIKLVSNSLFSSGSGRPIDIKESALKKARSALSRQHFPESSSLSREKSSLGSSESEAQGKIVSLFSSGSGGAISITTSSIKKAKENLRENTVASSKASTGDNMNSLFSTGSGKSLTVSNAALKNASRTINLDENKSNVTKAGGVKKKVNLRLKRHFVGDRLANKPILQDDLTIFNSCAKKLEQLLNDKVQDWEVNPFLLSMLRKIPCNKSILKIKNSIFFEDYTVGTTHRAILIVLDTNEKHLPFEYFLLNLILCSCKPKFKGNDVSLKILLQCFLSRYLYEVEGKRSPILKKIFDQGVRLERLTVLEVFHRVSNNWLFATDGWYLIPVKVIGKLCSSNANKCLKPGFRFGVCGANIANFSPDQYLCPVRLSLDLLLKYSPQAGYSKVPHIVLSVNNSKPITQTKRKLLQLGEQECCFFVKKLTQVECRMGSVSCIDANISRIFDRQAYYCGKDDLKQYLSPYELDLFTEKQQMDFSNLNANEEINDADENTNHFNYRLTFVQKFETIDSKGTIAQISKWNPSGDLSYSLKESRRLRCFNVDPVLKSPKFFLNLGKASFISFARNEAVDKVETKYELKIFQPLQNDNDKETNIVGRLITLKEYDHIFVTLFIKCLQSPILMSCKWRMPLPEIRHGLIRAEGKIICLRNVNYTGVDPSTNMFMFNQINGVSGLHVNRIVDAVGLEAKLLNKYLNCLRKQQSSKQNIYDDKCKLKKLIEGCFTSNKENVRSAANV